MRLKNLRNLFLGLALMSVVALVSYKIGEGKKVLSVNEGKFDLSLMWEVRDRLVEKYLDKGSIDNEKMRYGAIEGLVSALDDPYTMFLPPVENKSANEDLAGEFAGVGISLGYKDKTLAVMSPIAKSPAMRAGVQAGDLILKITDKSKNIDRDTSGISLDEAVKLIRGDVGTEVILKMYREGKADTFDVKLTRDNIEIPGMELEWKEFEGRKYAWVKFYKFSEQVFKDWPEIVTKIKKEKGSNYGGIILDMRNNPGGYLQASVLIASDFLKEGVVVKQESKKGIDEVYRVDPRAGGLIGDKLVVLVNGGSASAAEILAGALRDHNRAKIVGQKTFGKGTVQQTEEFKDGSGLHVTVARWLLPSGKNIHGDGLEPDVVVEPGENIEIDVQLNKAIEILKES
ncbi:MAG TPA: S41 family peptidase [Candidatus Woesebacteria bacterium]|jgi:carboxyl-terminal processing protease|nr:PDZ domain-containing protein [Candidatus Shapirobacteria bacterium]HOR02050.1 S41 family peptidase [Candidatus Woesebacteria bacterium]